MSNKLRPLGSKVLVKQSEADSITQGGIVLPESAKEKPKRGEVLAVGRGRMLESGERAPLQVQNGNRVIFNSYAGTEITVDNEEFMIMDESDILAIVE